MRLYPCRPVFPSAADSPLSAHAAAVCVSQLAALFRDVSNGLGVASFADFEAAFAKAEAGGPPLKFSVADSGRLAKLLGSRLGKLQEVRALFAMPIRFTFVH